MTSLETDMRRVELSSGDSDHMASKTKSLLRTLKHRAAHWAVCVLYPWPRGKRLKNGLTLKIDPKKRWIDLNLALRSHYEEGTLLLIEKLLPEGGVFVDVGANIGVMSTFAARHVGDKGLVFAFEPDAVNFARLTWARRANRLPQMLPFPVALGANRGVALLMGAPDGDGGLSSLVKLEGFQEQSTVPVVRMDEYLLTFDPARIDLIKIDVEGFEKDVVEGAAKVFECYKPAVIMEMVNDDAVRAGEALCRLGYRSFVAGEKGAMTLDEVCETVPKKLVHNNMLFVHASKTETLSSLAANNA
ncbi:MAG: FkbM family methyltransferase [Pseudomonadota bacterium]